MNILKFMFRKVVYVVAGTSTVALGSYLTSKQDISEWTLPGALIAVSTALWGTILSRPMGGSLSNPPR